MRKIIALIMLSLALLQVLPAKAYGYDNFSNSALYIPSYSDRFFDSLVNPAMLSRVESSNIFYFTTIISEEWDIGEIRDGGPLPFLQNLNSEFIFSFVGNNLSLSAIANTYFGSRHVEDGKLNMNVYNTFGIDLNWSYGFPYVSLGMRIKGGNTLIRRNKNITGILNAIENAYFSQFENSSGMEYFSIGASIAVEVGFFESSLMFDDIVLLRDSDLYAGWDTLLDSMSLSFSLRYPEFTKRGNLNFCRPRIGFSMKGNPADKMEITANAELQFQLLPDFDFNVAFGYKEKDHSLFDFDPSNGLLMLALELQGANYSIRTMCNIDTGTFTRVFPSISFTLAR